MSQDVQRLSKTLVVILAMLTAIIPLAIDMYLPAFSQMAMHFSVPINKIEITISIFLLGFALGQLIGGPISDRYGRKIMIFVGLFVYALSAYFISQSVSVEGFWVWRFLQAVGAGFAGVNTNAIVRDLYSGAEGAKVFSIITTIMMVAPMVAPALGSFIVIHLSWKYVFIFLALYASLVFYLARKLPETASKKKSQFHKNYIKIITHKKTLLLMLAGGLGTSGLFMYITKSPFIYLQYFGVSEAVFPFVFGVNVLVLMIVTQLNIRLLKTYHPMRMVFIGLAVQICSGGIFYAFHAVHTLYTAMIVIAFFIGSLGFIFGNVIALVLENFKEISATANAINGVIGFLLASLIGFVVSYLHSDTIASIALPMFVCACSSIVVLYLSHRAK